MLAPNSLTFPSRYIPRQYAAEIQDAGGKVAVFNISRSEGNEEGDFLFLGSCEETLPKALGLSN
jgi:NAD-dependent deacetylase sirtuin 5